MAKSGPKPKGKRGPKRPAAVSASAWACPSHLTGEAAKAWDHVVDLLDAKGNLDKTDTTLVEAYAITTAMLRDANREIVARGTLITSGLHGTLIANPACSVANAATMRLKALANDLGLTPSSSKYAADTAPAKAADGWDGLLDVVG